MRDYDAHAVEAKWLARWNEVNLYRIDLNHAKRPFYNLMEFPYPSGEGLHVGISIPTPVPTRMAATSA